MHPFGIMLNVNFSTQVGKQRGSGGYDGCASKERPEAKKKQKLEHEPEPECGEEK